MILIPVLNLLFRALFVCRMILLSVKERCSS